MNTPSMKEDVARLREIAGKVMFDFGSRGMRPELLAIAERWERAGEEYEKLKILRAGEIPDVGFSCRVHPTDWFHEVGCDCREWTVKELKEALLSSKRGQMECWLQWQQGELKRDGALRTKLADAEKERDAAQEILTQIKKDFSKRGVSWESDSLLPRVIEHAFNLAVTEGFQFLRERDAAISRAEQAEKRLEEAVRAIGLLMPLAVNGVPQRGHVGACGPESGCDAICMEVESCAEIFRATRSAQGKEKGC